MKELKQLENKKIDLSSIKVAIFDFDDTLAIHKDKDYLKHRNENEENLLNYYLNAYLNPESFYETIEPCLISDSLQNLIKTFETKGVKIYCVLVLGTAFLYYESKINNEQEIIIKIEVYRRFGTLILSAIFTLILMRYELIVIEFILLGLSIIEIFVNKSLCNKLSNYSIVAKNG